MTWHQSVAMPWIIGLSSMAAQCHYTYLNMSSAATLHSPMIESIMRHEGTTTGCRCFHLVPWMIGLSSTAVRCTCHLSCDLLAWPRMIALSSAAQGAFGHVLSCRPFISRNASNHRAMKCGSIRHIQICVVALCCRG